MTPEATLQSSCFKWFRYAYPQYSKLFFAIPNGGSRNILEATNLKRQGVTAGVSDTFLSVPNAKRHGLYIEFKIGKNKVSRLQQVFFTAAEQQGYATATVYSFDEFITTVKNYFNEK